MSSQIQVKLTLPPELKALLDIKASKFGFSTNTYIKFLLANDIQNSEFPVKQASPKVLKAEEEAIQDVRQGHGKKFQTGAHLKKYFAAFHEK